MSHSVTQRALCPRRDPECGGHPMSKQHPLVEAAMRAQPRATPIENALVDGWEALVERFPHLDFQSCREAQHAAATAIAAFLRGLELPGDWLASPSILAQLVEEAACPSATPDETNAGQDGEPGW